MPLQSKEATGIGAALRGMSAAKAGAIIPAATRKVVARTRCFMMSTPACQLNEFIVYRVLIVSFVYPSTGRNAVTFEQQTPQIVRTIRRPGATPHRKNTTDALAMLRGPGSPRTSAGRLAGDQPAVRAGWGGFDHRIKRRAEPTGCRQKAPLRAIDPRERAMPAGAA